MASYCPQCGAAQRCEVMGALGFAKPQPFIEKRYAQRRMAARRPVPLDRIAREEWVGRLTTRYVCLADCGCIVSPGLSHIRNWDQPDYWRPVPIIPIAAPPAPPRRAKKRKRR